MKPLLSQGYTLIELIVAVGLFAVVMTLSSGAYLLMINANRQAQAQSGGINNLAFAAETMLRTIRTGRSYSCNGVGDCPSGGSTFSVVDQNGVTQTFTLTGTAITENNASLTDFTSVTVNSLTFYVDGTHVGDSLAPYATIVITGQVTTGPGKTMPFTIETGAEMRGSDI